MGRAPTSRVGKAGKMVAAGLLLLSLSGCWNDRALNERDLVLTMGVSPAKKSGQVELTFQIPTPGGLTSMQVGGGSGGSSSPQFFDVQGIGPNFPLAFTEAQAKVSRDLYLGQIEVLAFSTKLSPAMLHRAVAALDRLGPMDKTPYVITTMGSVTKVIAHQSQQEKLPALYFETLFLCKSCQTNALGVHFWQFAERLHTPGISAVLPQVDLSSSGYTVDKISVYRGYHYVTTFSPSLTQDYGLLADVSHKNGLFLAKPFQSGLRAVDAKTSIRTTLAKGRLKSTLDVKVKATLDSISTYTATPTQVAQVAKAASVVLSRRLDHFLALTQKLDIDPVGIGRRLDSRHPSWFKAAGPWFKAYPRIDFKVHVQVHVRRIGDLT